MPRARVRRRLSMTSLIDVIFLLLLFFMLSSTFSKFGEVPLLTAGQGAQAPLTAQDVPPVLVRISEDGPSLNGMPTEMDRLTEETLRLNSSEQPKVLISLSKAAQSEQLVQALYQLRKIPKAQIIVVN